MDGQDSASILVLGGPSTGKTHYGAQLLGRLEEGSGRLAMRGVPGTIGPLEEVLRRLGQGQTASHTATTTYTEIILPVRSSDGLSLDLVWPDYGGEQLRDLLRKRHVGPAWRQRVEQSSGWLLFVRPDRIRSYDDILSRPRGDIHLSPPDDGASARAWSSQAEFVEILQLLLFTSGVGTRLRVGRPALGIVLSCWDELGGEDARARPADLLTMRMPLVGDFVASVWRAESLRVYGLSSLGKALKSDTPDGEYIDRGPERFGYVVLPDGTRSPDLTLPIHALAGSMA